MRLEDLCTFYRGLTYAKKDEVDFSKNAVLRANNVSLDTGELDFSEIRYINDQIDIPAHKKVQKGSLLMCMASGSKKHLGKAALVDEDYQYAFGGFMGLLVPNAAVDSKYFYWITRSKSYSDFIMGLSDGANINNLKFSQLSQYQLPVPPLSEQKRIVAILDEVFAGIATVTANTEKNLANARELFESYLNAVFTQRGDNWAETNLGDLCEKITKGSSPKWQGIKYQEKPGVLFVTSENVGQNELLFQKKKYVEEAFNKKDAKSVLKKGDVLTNIVGASIGRTAVFDMPVLANINQAVCLLRCKPEKLNSHFLAYLLNSPFFRRVLHENEINNARANLSLGFFRQLSIPYPAIANQKEIVSKINSLSAECKILESICLQKLTALAELKQSLLQKAFSGELTADKDISEAIRTADEIP